MFIPTPGLSILITTSPIISANVVTTSKYKIAFKPTLPTFLVFCIPAIPLTIVQKMMGAIIIFISLIKPSPNGFKAMANVG